MPTPTKGPRMGGSPAHQRLMMANHATALFEHGQITTTEAKARKLRPFAERLVTKAKRGDLHARRQVSAVIRDKAVVHELFTEIAPGYAGRSGGYTRITKIGPRKGDNAPMAVIELVEPLAEQTVAEATAATKRAAKEKAAAAVAAPAAAAAAEVADAASDADADVAETATDDALVDAETVVAESDAEAQDEIVAEAEEVVAEIEAEAADAGVEETSGDK